MIADSKAMAIKRKPIGLFLVLSRYHAYYNANRLETQMEGRYNGNGAEGKLGI